MPVGVTYPMVVDCLGLDADACAGMEGQPVFEALATQVYEPVEASDGRVLLCATPGRCLEELHVICLMSQDFGLAAALAQTLPAARRAVG